MKILPKVLKNLFFGDAKTEFVTLPEKIEITCDQRFVAFNAIDFYFKSVFARSFDKWPTENFPESNAIE